MIEEQTASKGLVYIDEHGLIGSNFYWYKYAEKGMTKEEVMSVGLIDDRVLLHESLIKPLLAVDAELQKQGFRLYVKEGYRSEELYELIYKKRVEKFGKEETDRLLNMTDMPHAKGTSVDIALWDMQTNTEKYLRNAADGTDALFVDFYKDKHDEQSQEFQRLQQWLIGLMVHHGFELGTKKEYFHFNYRS